MERVVNGDVGRAKTTMGGARMPVRFPVDDGLRFGRGRNFG